MEGKLPNYSEYAWEKLNISLDILRLSKARLSVV
jgi:hypothetical protein